MLRRPGSCPRPARPSPKFERYAIHGLSSKRESIAIEFARLKKVIEKPAIAFRIGITRNKADDVTRVFDGELHKLPVAQKTIHAGIIRTGPCWDLPIRIRLRASRH